MYTAKKIPRIATVFIVATCALGLITIAPTVSAQTETRTTLSEQDQLILEMIQRLQETIVVLQRKLTTINGQQDGQNLINENSIAETNETTILYEKPNYDSNPSAEQPTGTLGEVSAGPRLIDGEVWWRFDFRDGTSGWSPEAKLTRVPSTLLKVDSDGNGETDSTLRLVGEYDADGFVVEPFEGGTAIYYEGETVEPYDIIEN